MHDGVKECMFRALQNCTNLSYQHVITRSKRYKFAALLGPFELNNAHCSCFFFSVLFLLSFRLVSCSTIE